MGAYIPVIIWVASMVVCHYIAKSRNVKLNSYWIVLIAIFGPLAIPFVFLAKPAAKQSQHR